VALCGILKQTFYRWLREAEKDDAFVRRLEAKNPYFTAPIRPLFAACVAGSG
jgi:protease II